MRSTVDIDHISVDKKLYEFIAKEAIPGSGVNEQDFWHGFASMIAAMSPRNATLLRRRDELQKKIDDWHREHRKPGFDPAEYRSFLSDIGYLVAEKHPFQVRTANVDPEIASLAGPQLVVPASNARYALNAANARWGSLYDALYGTDALPDDGAPRGGKYDAVRGGKVIAYVRRLLDQHFPLLHGSHVDAVAYRSDEHGLQVQLNSGIATRLRNEAAYLGFQGVNIAPTALLLVHHGLHVELQIDRSHHIGRDDAAGISDVILESALTTIQDCEDSVAAVDAVDKVQVYRHWLGLMKGDLEARVEKGAGAITRRLNPDRRYQTPAGADLVLRGRSLMLVRNVGHHMLTDMVTLDGQPVPETLIDAAVTALAAVHDLKGNGPFRNTVSGSVYIVKPKLHGPEEVAFAVEIFAAVERLLGLAVNTLKIGIMDEERRTSVNLLECIRAAHERVVFINTGFLDRTGDEIHTSMEAGIVPRKSDLKKAVWLDAYERQNVDIGLACGLRGRAQIGKGMWAMPDLMADMMKTKVAHPLAGANTAWVPSPTAATLHALHYLEIDVEDVQTKLASRPRALLAELLTPPLVATAVWSDAQLAEELNNNAQSILGYVVRWVDAGIGCSKVPDYYNVALMEDRATLRISSQHVANWLHHRVCSPEQVMKSLHDMAAVVDAQNVSDPGYRPMSKDAQNNVAFQTACALVFQGRNQPNGYTEAILTQGRTRKKTTAPSSAPVTG